MNPFPAGLMKPLERRAELCRILALGLIRLRMRRSGAVPASEQDYGVDFVSEASMCPVNRRGVGR